MKDFQYVFQLSQVLKKKAKQWLIQQNLYTLKNKYLPIYTKVG